MIISGGENVFPQEVEDCLAGYEAVVEVAALGNDDEFGKRRRAFVVLSSADVVDESELKDHVQSSLARYNVPRDFVSLDKLPHNVTGRVPRRELLDHEAA